VREEARSSFACFGGTVTVRVRCEDQRAIETKLERARERLLEAHRCLTRFDPDSELCRLNRDPRAVVRASPMLRALASAVRHAGELSGGLVDATVIESLERAGYRESLAGEGDVGRAWEAPQRFAPRRPARADPAGRWRFVGVDERAGTILRPPGLRIDGGGIAKGLLADLVGRELETELAYAVDCCGDMRIGGVAGRPRRMRIGNPFGGEPVAELAVVNGGVATSGVARRSWTGPDGEPAHHLIDPGRGEPAHTGIVQATALAPSAFLAEVYAKVALLSGPGAAAGRLPHGGTLVYEDGRCEVLPHEAGVAPVALSA
jgi:thiamine biosynthesis lipoprotein